MLAVEDFNMAAKTVSSHSLAIDHVCVYVYYQLR